VILCNLDFPHISAAVIAGIKKLIVTAADMLNCSATAFQNLLCF
jgi:hypothetical protein